MDDKATNDTSDFLQGFTLTPNWAKTASSEQTFDKFAREERSGDRRPPRRDRAERGHDFRGREMPRPPRPSSPRSDGGGGFHRDHDSRSDAPRREYREQTREPRPHFQRPPQEQVEFPVEVRFLPESKALSVLMHKVAKNHRALPVRDLARLFLDNPATCEIRMEFKEPKNAEGKDKVFYQCKRCGVVTLNEETLREHAFSAHFAEEFTMEEIEGDAPAGNFTCVAKCGITGELLGPPNHHSYNQRIAEMLRTKCANVPPEVYRSRIQLVHDAEAVNQWREQAKKKVVYKRKVKENGELRKENGELGGLQNTEVGNPEPVTENTDAVTPPSPAPVETPTAEPEIFDRPSAEALFAQDILPQLMHTVKHAVCPQPIGMDLNDFALRAAVRSAWRREVERPFSLFFALRGALKHKKMTVFRANDNHGMEFVISREPSILDVQHAVPELKAIVDYITAHPGVTRAELLKALGVTEEGDALEHNPYAQQLKWVTERANVIEFFNGTLSLPDVHPHFRSRVAHHDGKDKAKEKPEGEAKQADNAACTMDNGQCTMQNAEKSVSGEQCAVSSEPPLNETVLPSEPTPSTESTTPSLRATPSPDEGEERGEGENEGMEKETSGGSTSSPSISSLSETSPSPVEESIPSVEEPTPSAEGGFPFAGEGAPEGRGSGDHPKESND